MKNLYNILAIISLTILTGCANQHAWVYRPNTYPLNQAGTGKTATVLPFDDARPNDNNNALLLYMVPLMPFGWANFNTPEGIQMHVTSGMWINYKPTEDFPKALAEELRKAGVFKEVFFDFRKGTSDYVIQGRIINTKYGGRIFSYGLSVYGPILWIIGCPAGTTKNELSVELSCVDSRTDKVLFSKTYQALPRSNVSFLYVMKNDFNYGEMLAEIYKQFCQDVRPFIPAGSPQP